MWCVCSPVVCYVQSLARRQLWEQTAMWFLINLITREIKTFRTKGEWFGWMNALVPAGPAYKWHTSLTIYCTCRLTLPNLHGDTCLLISIYVPPMYKILTQNASSESHIGTNQIYLKHEHKKHISSSSKASCKLRCIQINGVKKIILSLLSPNDFMIKLRSQTSATSTKPGAVKFRAVE